MSVDRFTIGYQLDGREWRPYVESGDRRVSCVYEDLNPKWADGTPMTAADMDVARGVIERVFRHWHLTAEFFVPEETQ